MTRRQAGPQPPLAAAGDRCEIAGPSDRRSRVAVYRSFERAVEEVRRAFE